MLFAFQNWLDPAKEIKKQVRSKFFGLFYWEHEGFQRVGLSEWITHTYMTSCKYKVF